jgi:hypothetical protein
MLIAGIEPREHDTLAGFVIVTSLLEGTEGTLVVTDPRR